MAARYTKVPIPRKRGYIKTDMKNERYIKARQIARDKYDSHPRIVVALDAGVKLAGDGAWVAASVYVSSADIGVSEVKHHPGRAGGEGLVFRRM